MIKVLFWNSRGAGSEKFRSDIADLVKLHSIDILAVCEPRVQFSKAKDSLLSLGFTDYIIVEANGFSGGIWLFWKSNLLKVHFVDKNCQSITVRVTLPGGITWMLTVLYASPTNSVRSSLWNYFDHLVSTHQLPWIFIGDYNELYSSADKNFGSTRGRIRGLKQWVDHNALIDMGFIGSKFTWSNNRIKERLDRAFCTCDWRSYFPEAFIRHLAKMKSDHCPILLQLHSNNSVNRAAIPFRFQAMWMTHNDFAPYVDNTWKNSHGSFVEKTQALSHALLDWNHNTFGNVFKKRDNCLPALVESRKLLTGLKAPGFDGFPAAFYQTFWNLYAAEVFSIVRNAFNAGEVPCGLNHTIICLVPKVSGPQSMMQFRPISLCNTVYKVVSKIIVARIRPYMQKLVSPNQVSYVPGRQISDNIMIAQEVLFKFKKSAGKKGFFAWKVDLSKAYDRLNWQFIESVLYESLLPQSLVKLIMSCITSTSFQICLNGELTQSFNAQQGIRQGDPLSPYIFVLCMEKLSHLIQSTVDIGAWKAVRASQSGPKISHLFFADDLMLFSEATSDQACIIKQCLDTFCSLSGQAVSYEKSLIFCSPNTSNEIAADISSTCGSPLTTDLGKYLGMPLIHSRITKSTYASILDKVQNRLAGWKCKVLSLAGRLTLIHSVTATIPNYAMQTTRLPMYICDDLDKINRNFLWGDTENKKKIHLVNWDTVCLPKNLGGLGIKKSSDMNQSMLAKTGWRLFQNDSGLWASIYREKYLKRGWLFDQNYQQTKDCSSTWRSVLNGVNLLKKGLIWRVGDGRKIKFWTDVWFPPTALINYALPDSIINIEDTVCSFWNDNGWDLNLLSDCIPTGITDQILRIPPGFDGCGDDTQIWGGTSNGSFSVKSAYNIFFEDYEQMHSPWKFIWKMQVPPKLKTFLWVLCHGKLLTNAHRVKRNLTDDDTCPICRCNSESLSHLFKDCPAALNVWNSFTLPQPVKFTFSMSWEGWLQANLFCKAKCNAGNPWCSTFAFICWFIWKWRNKHIFEAHFQIPNHPGMVINAAIFEWSNAQLKSDLNKTYCLNLLNWMKPPHGYHKLNIDGSRNGHFGKIGAGGVIRCSNGLWIKGFQINLGIGEVLDAESWGLFYGLQQALKCHITHIEVETDSAILAKLISQSDVALHPMGSLIRCCKNLIRGFLCFSLKHIYRESNMVADCLAKESINHDYGIIEFDGPPIHASSAYIDDLVGVTRQRRIPIRPNDRPS
ncbi:uncharacterized protein LOC112194030 [Rosa chinensis]|uniref:uncharacterized protein LOC112194030 n=1 Tax=Rosa chinensis TaxID=74649 RepID=UPI001AD91156|nr:uncharacterized protein LOC112194030 [Rosa chinensis]